MTKQQQDVRTFMQTFGQATPETPVIPDDNVRILRVKLLLEEVLELAEASGVKIVSEVPKGEAITRGNLQVSSNGDNVYLVGVADALADIDYVNQGAAVAYGLNLEPFQDEVHSSNMSKLWSEDDLATDALKVGYLIYGSNQGKYVVKNPDGKVIKSPSYRPADLKKVLAEQLNSV